MNAPLPARLVLRWDPYLEPDESDMEFKLTYAGKLLAHSTDGKRIPERSLHVHTIRRCFHKQLQRLWETHPNLMARAKEMPDAQEIFSEEGFRWAPLVTKGNGLICKLDILMLRDGKPGEVLADIDNRLKTIFDALRKADGPNELGKHTASGQFAPAVGENPFYVLLQDDKLITHIAVTTETLLEPVPDEPRDTAVRLVIGVTIRPYHSHMDNADFL